MLAVTLCLGCAYSTLPLTEPVPRVAPLASIPEPSERKAGNWYAFAEASFFSPAEWLFDVPLHLRRATGRQQRAMNVDSFGELLESPDWFASRNLARPLSPEELERGPGAPPAAGVWTVTAGKHGGIQPGLEIEDAAGRRFLLKLDNIAHPEMATTAEVVAQRIYWAAGYNVPEVHLVHFRPEDLRLSPGATYRSGYGFECPLTGEALAALLSGAPRRPDGSYRAVAVGIIGGRLKGPFSFLGTRADDANDTIAHQHRRELRALYVISSFVHNPDVIESNTLDSYVTEGGVSFLKHHLIDFGTSLGSYAFAPKPRRSGHEYAIDWREIAKSLFSAGLYRRPYEGQPLDIRPGVGWLDNTLFDPGSWRPEYPNPAFSYLTAEDGLWGARLVMSFTDEQIRAAVRAARLGIPEAEGQLAGALIQRRDMIGRYWFAQTSPLVDFTLAGQTLSFRDLAKEHGLAAETTYEARVGEGVPVGFAATSLPLAALEGIPERGAFEVEVRAVREGERLPPVRLELHRDETGLQLRGLRREGR